MASSVVAQFYEVINSGTAAVAPGANVSFSQTAFITQGIGVSQNSPTVFALGLTPPDQFVSYYRVTWQVGVANSGQLGVYSADLGGLQANSIVGTSWGHCQIIGDCIIQIGQSGATLSIQNPSANNSSLNLLSSGSGNVDVIVTLTFEYISPTT